MENNAEDFIKSQFSSELMHFGVKGMQWHKHKGDNRELVSPDNDGTGGSTGYLDDKGNFISKAEYNKRTSGQGGGLFDKKSTASKLKLTPNSDTNPSAPIFKSTISSKTVFQQGRVNKFIEGLFDHKVKTNIPHVSVTQQGHVNSFIEGIFKRFSHK